MSEEDDLAFTISARRNFISKEPQNVSRKVNTTKIQKIKENQNFSSSVPVEVPPSSEERQQKLKSMFGKVKPEEKYLECGEIARGGMGVVYSVMDKNLLRGLAMKILLPPNNPGDLKRNVDFFIEEARISAQLQHPNIVPVHDIGLLADGNVFFTMKHVKGEPLSKIIHRLADGESQYLQKYNLYHKLSIFRRVCDAIAFGHSRQVVHRDIKPENIMIGEYGEVLTLDWGLAKFIGKEAPKDIKDSTKVYSLRMQPDFSKTQDGYVQGTPRYFSPEQTMGDSSLIDTRSDIYLLGATLYHLLTLEFPHDGKNLDDLVYRVQNGHIIPPEQTRYGKQIPIQISNIVKKAMAIDKENRYQTVNEMSKEIDAFLEGEITCAPIEFKKGEFLIRTGEVGHEGYVILSGNVKVFANINGKEVIFANMGPGDVVGEMAIISSQKRSANVQATRDTKVLVIDRERMEDTLKRLPPWMEKIVLNLVDRLRVANDNVHPLKINNSLAHILIQLATIVSHTAYNSEEDIADIVFNIHDLKLQVANMLSLPTENIDKSWENILDSGLFERDGDNLTLEDVEILYTSARLCAQESNIVSEVYDIFPEAVMDKKIRAEKIIHYIKNSESKASPSEVKKQETTKKEEISISEKVKMIIAERLGEIHKLLEKEGLTDKLDIQYSVEAAGEQGEKLSVSGHLSQK